MKHLFKLAFVAALFSLSIFAQKPDSSVKVEPKPSPAAVKLPEAKDVVDKYVNAIGGRDALMKPKTRYQTGTIELSPTPWSQAA